MSFTRTQYNFTCACGGDPDRLCHNREEGQKCLAEAAWRRDLYKPYVTQEAQVPAGYRKRP